MAKNKITTKKKPQSDSRINYSMLFDITALIAAVMFVLALGYNIRQHEIIITILDELERHGFSAVGGSVGVDIPLMYLLGFAVVATAVGGIVRVRRGDSFLTKTSTIAVTILLTGVMIWGVGLDFATKNLFQIQTGL